jgi:D-alanine--poly(phosphoribitol) ligase subunit 1
MNLIQKYFDTFCRNSSRDAFCLQNEKYSYHEFLHFVNGSRQLLESQPDFKPQIPVGVLCHENVETYAAVFAVWFSGGIFVPLNPEMPVLANQELIRKFQIKYIFEPVKNDKPVQFEGVIMLNSKSVVSEENLPLSQWEENHTLYVLNTSGSTGTPKNVPISLKNLTAFIEGYLEKYPELNADDKFLQTYELTADAAFTGYLIPFLLGATVYSVPHNTFKPFAVAKILSENSVTWVKATPTLVACLRPFFSSFHLPEIRHFHFGGEALPANLIAAWRLCVPNAEISNGYGPTETSVTATIYKCMPGETIKEKNNIVSIGQPFKKVEIYMKPVSGKKEKAGELYIGGPQMMTGYWFSEKQPFEILNVKGLNKKFYPTGDKVCFDNDGFLYFLGRLNDQVKINGYRIDLVEIENGVRKLVPGTGNVAAIAADKSGGLKQLVVFIERYNGNGKEITEAMALNFPSYKIPEKIIGLPEFPVNRSGKTDKKKLAAYFLSLQNHD